ncbi:GGDEF domain-containing protein [uncultured Thiodictyon sp.]|uniref:GGDEF domain-containing protein n=1 Tax=uncultured Thiodictyon sp. TaxID=1846217 RepID=UPI0025D4099F|nr:GGDEF domain-containing protein [uncultured Thiodictyon sp.]
MKYVSLTKTVEHLEKISKVFWAITGATLIIVLGFVDVVTGYELSFSLFYLVPVSLLAWFAGKRYGIAASIASAGAWLSADVLSGNHYSETIIYFWNSAIRFGFFIIVTLLLVELKKALEYERILSRIDRLTGATSVDFFYELLQAEINLFRRYRQPFTVAYVDLDNFKAVNDQFGHSTGDRVLNTVVTQTRKELRKTDIVARLGGDEFAILFPETDQRAAQIALSKIQRGLLNEMLKNNWPVTFSIGVVTFNATPNTANELIKMADDLMYAVKKNEKNAIRYSVYAG